MPVPSIRAIGANNNGTSSSWSAVTPATAQVGDQLIAIVNSIGGGFATPAGWTLREVQSVGGGSFFCDLMVYERTCQAGDPGGTVSGTFAASTTWSAVVLAAKDHSATPQNDTGATGTDASLEMPASPGSIPGSFLRLEVFAQTNSGGAPAFSGYTGVGALQLSMTNTYGRCNIYTQSASASSTPVLTSNLSSGWATITVLIPGINQTQQMVL